MKLPIQVNGKTVEIELTNDQIEIVKKANQKITDRIKTEEDIWREAGVTKSFWGKLHVFDQLALLGSILNEGWKPDWNDSSQYKYEPYFKWNGSAFVFDSYIAWSQHTIVGSRLCFKSSDLAIYTGKQFIDLYNKILSL
jgi:hypothetical protein